MPSPPRRRRGSSPRRGAPLHERPESYTNQKPGPSLRLVGDPEVSIIEAGPYPTKPSQILAPTAISSRVGAVSTQDSHCSLRMGRYAQDHGSKRSTQAPGKSGAATERKYMPDSLAIDLASSNPNNGQNRAPSSTTGSCLSTAGPEYEEEERGHTSSDWTFQSPNTSPRPSNPPFTPYRDTSPERHPTSKESDGSINSTGTVVVKKNRDGKRRASYSAFPFSRPSSSKSSLGLGIPQRSKRNPSSSSGQVSPVCPSTPTSPSFQSTSDHQVASVPHYTNLQDVARSKDTEVQYPIIRSQPTSASFAEVGPLPQAPQQATDRGQERWNPHLSTVQSEGTGSNSEERSSQGTWPLGSSRASKSSSNMMSPRRSSDYPPVPRLSSEWSPAPGGSSDLPSIPSPSPSGFPSPPQHAGFQGPRPITTTDTASPTLRIIEGPRVHAGEQRSIRPTGQGAQDTGLRPQENGRIGVTRPGSRASFFRDSIPAWAKAYYARPNSAILAPRSDSRLDSLSRDQASSNNPNAHSGAGVLYGRRNSRLQWPHRPKELTLAQTQAGARRPISSNWSPHLWHDRTSLGRRRSIFQAPAVDDQAQGRAVSGRNIQIVCFTVGFVMPLLWLVASFLPLPRLATDGDVKEKGDLRRTQAAEDLEKQLGPCDEAWYENARWWRNINRIMAVVGIVLIVAIVALAVVGSR